MTRKLLALLTLVTLAGSGCSNGTTCGAGRCPSGSVCDTSVSPPVCANSACMAARVEEDLSGLVDLTEDIERDPTPYASSFAAAAGRLTPKHFAFGVQAWLRLVEMVNGGLPPFDLLEDPRLDEVLSAASDLPLIAELRSTLRTSASSSCLTRPVLMNPQTLTAAQAQSIECATNCNVLALVAGDYVAEAGLRELRRQLQQGLRVAGIDAASAAAALKAIRAIERGEDVLTNLRTVGEILSNAYPPSVSFSGTTRTADYEVQLKALPGLYSITATLRFARPEPRNEPVYRSCLQAKADKGCARCPDGLVCAPPAPNEQCIGFPHCEAGFLLSCSTLGCASALPVDGGACTPNCMGRQCGDNGCGGSCGSCSSGSICNNGTCQVGGVSQFNGSYQGGYSGSATTPQGSGPVSGSVAMTISNGAITLTSPAQGSGSLSADGSASFSSAGSVSTANANCTWSGGFQLQSGGGATGSGPWSCSLSGGGSASGTWNVARQ